MAHAADTVNQASAGVNGVDKSAFCFACLM
jgi:hypothetical protein